jgi:hypothetical protein
VLSLAVSSVTPFLEIEIVPFTLVQPTVSPLATVVDEVLVISVKLPSEPFQRTISA